MPRQSTGPAENGHIYSYYFSLVYILIQCGPLIVITSFLMEVIIASFLPSLFSLQIYNLYMQTNLYI